MVTFVTDKPVRSKVPEVVVENPLEPGRYRFNLVVVDDSNNESAPFELVVSVVQRVRPRPDIEILREPVLRRTVPIERLRVIRPQ